MNLTQYKRSEQDSVRWCKLLLGFGWLGSRGGNGEEDQAGAEGEGCTEVQRPDAKACLTGGHGRSVLLENR